MSGDLYTLAYFSRSAMQSTDETLEGEIQKILAVARENNQKLDVTGALLFSAGCFAQVLEGPLDAVEALFEQIECDPRHKNVTILHFRPVTARSFGDWSMAYAGHVAGAFNRLSLDGLLNNPDHIHSEEAGRDVVAILSGLIHRTEMAHDY